jgi:hypothetical protein
MSILKPLPHTPKPRIKRFPERNPRVTMVVGMLNQDGIVITDALPNLGVGGACGVVLRIIASQNVND